MKIGIACDHAGFAYKEKLKTYLISKAYEVMDYGTHSNKRADYPDFAHALGEAIDKQECDYGFVLCGSGNGITMTANKHKKVRAALCWNTEVTKLARQHNDANVCGIPARFIAYELTEQLADIFLSTIFEGGRHQQRIEKI